MAENVIELHQRQPQQQQPNSLDSTFESIIIDIPQCVTFSSTTVGCASSSYDTDSSVNSTTCCTKHNEHIYMQKAHHQSNKKQLHQQHEALKMANNDMEAVYYKADNHRKSWPIFIFLISLLEITVFVYDILTVRKDPSDLLQAVPQNSVFIYNPDRRLQIWRFVSYMFLHANWFHLGFNIILQLFYGIPLEVMHGSARVAVIYFAGVFAGSLGTSVVDSDVCLVGASGGVYAILAGHLANITLNYGQMRYATVQLLSVGIFIFCDIGHALYIQYLLHDPEALKAPPVSYIAHLTGALAGLTIGLLVLKNFEHRAYENLIWWLALGTYCAFTVFAIVFNLINSVTAQRMEEQSEVITQHLLHDLGVS